MEISLDQHSAHLINAQLNRWILSLDLNVANVLASDLFCKLIPTVGGNIAKSGLPLFCVNPWYF